EAERINLYRPSISYRVEVKKDKYSKKMLLSYKLLHNILKNQFLVPKKTLKDLFNKWFIYISTFSVIILILFIRKLSRRL
ncbi:hypothetical protein B0T13DRAFT_408857, partial [Neurospora crassa]